MKPLGWKNQIASPDRAIGRSSGVLGQNKSFLHYVGWMSGQKSSPLPVGGEVFLLTSPFIELHGTWPTSDGVIHARCGNFPRKWRPRITSGLPTTHTLSAQNASNGAFSEDLQHLSVVALQVSDSSSNHAGLTSCRWARGDIAGALHADGIGGTLSVIREVKMEIPAYSCW